MGIEILLYIIIGGFAGMLAGLLGVGGGLIIVPCLVFIYTYLGFNEDVLVHIAIGTSLASIIFTGTSSAYAHYIKDSVDTKILIPITAGIVIGAFIGAVIADHINGNDLRKIIGAFALIMLFKCILMLINICICKTKEFCISFGWWLYRRCIKYFRTWWRKFFSAVF